MDQTITDWKETHCYVKLVMWLLYVWPKSKIRIGGSSIKTFYKSPEFIIDGKKTKTFSQCLLISYQVKSYSGNMRQLRHITMQKLS